MNADQSIILIGMLAVFSYLQISVWWIGNRAYSIDYETRCLVRRRGLCKLIYFKPEHFGRYSIWEVAFFFFSYLQLILFSVLFALSFFYDIARVAARGAVIVVIVSLTAMVARIAYNDITCAIEDRKMGYRPKRKKRSEIPSYGIPGVSDKLMDALDELSRTIKYQLQYLYDKKRNRIKNGDREALERLADEFVWYFKNYLNVEVDEDKETVILKGKLARRYEIECSFDSQKRSVFPDLNGAAYRPHLVVKGTKDYLGIEFVSADVDEFDTPGRAEIVTLYSLALYENLNEGAEFTIREGPKIVGTGKILSVVPNGAR